MAISTQVILVRVPTESVIYLGAKVVSVFFAGQHLFCLDLGSITVGCWIIGLSAAAYVFVGGLKACAWTDLIWGAALIVGGAVVMWLALGAMKKAAPNDLIATKVANSSATVADLESASGWKRFTLLNGGKDGEAVGVEAENMAGGKLHMGRPKSDPAIPWTALVLGLWIPNFFYWGLNQYIVQRTLGSKSLAEGQKGIVFAAALKLIIPFMVVIPGILCFNLYSKNLYAEAIKKNKITFGEMQKDRKKVYPITENFALTNPAQAREVMAHNAKIVSSTAEIAATANPKEMLAANTLMLNATKAAKSLKAPSSSAMITMRHSRCSCANCSRRKSPGSCWPPSLEPSSRP
jgi:SSS family solute:Na+ symporter